MPKITQPRIIKAEDLVRSIADAFQTISYAHPTDFIEAYREAWEREPDGAAKNAMAQVLSNARRSVNMKRPVCQDTGLAEVFLDVGVDTVIVDDYENKYRTDSEIEKLVNFAVADAYTDKKNPLRGSIIVNPATSREPTSDNTPAFVHVHRVEGNKIGVRAMAKGGGSENKSKFAVLNPSVDVVKWVVDQVATMGAGWCPPGVISIGIGGPVEMPGELARQGLFEPINIKELLAKNRDELSEIERMRVEIYKGVNALGIGAQGLGGATTVLDVKIVVADGSHAASKNIMVIPNCSATRCATFELDGTGPVKLPEPDLSIYPEIDLKRDLGGKKVVNLDALRREDVAGWNVGETLVLNGWLVTARDAAHERIKQMLANGEELPKELSEALAGRIVYYVGPVDPVGSEVVGPAGPTTSTRMDEYQDLFLDPNGPIKSIGSIGKAERGPKAVEAIGKHGGVYMIAVGGAAGLVSEAIKEEKTVAFADLGMEAVRMYRVKGMEVMVAVNARGEKVHKVGPEKFREMIRLVGEEGMDPAKAELKVRFPGYRDPNTLQKGDGAPDKSGGQNR